MREEYAGLQAVVEEAGFFTTFQPIRQPGDRIICASHAYTSGPRRGGLCGNSFWVAKRRGKWFIATWAPVIYRLSDPARLGELCVRLLRREPAGAYADFDDQVRTEFGLIEIPDDEFVD
ncbi:MAG TPA: hypothetical protein VH575_05240 [Gemmataceae bacterium]|jgi:hypothetical protein